MAYGMLHGVLTASDSTTFVATGTDYFFFGGVVQPGSASGTYTAGAGMSGTLTGANPATFAASYDARYLEPAKLSDIAGTWTLTAVSLGGFSAVVLTVSNTGQISTNQPGCVQTGTVAPRPSGKNVFDVSLSYAGTSCAFDGKTLTGVGVLLQNATTVKSLTVAVLLPDGSDGFLATGNK